MSIATSTLLDTIVAATRRVVEVREAARPLAALAALAEAASPRADAFHAALTRPDATNIIAECKRRSPSRGILRASYEPAAVTSGYEAAGAVAVSVLTEPTFFDGSLEHLTLARAATRLPILRKDFIVTEYQLYETRAAGADAVLVIVAALSDAALPALLDGARRLGLAALVEVHTQDELDRAVQAGASMVGVNNRDLRTLEVDLTVAHDIVARVPQSVVRVAESGLTSAAELLALRRAGYHAFLMGERFMTAPDPGEALREVLDGGGQP